MGPVKTALLIAEHFPPSFAVGGKRPYRFARYMLDFGWRPIVLTRAAPPADRCDDTPHPLPPGAIVDRSLMPAWVRGPRDRPSDGTRAEPTVDTPRTEPTWIRRALCQVAVPMGPWRLLAPWFHRRIDRLVQTHRPDVLYVTSSPYYLLEVGVAAARRTGLPLCLDLRDPWSLNFNQQHKAAWVRRREAQLERAFFGAADRVVLTCEAAVQAYRALYPELPPTKLARIYNGFDPAMQPARPAARSHHVDLVHFGNCYGPRKLATVLRGVAAVRRRAIAGADRIRVVNLGRPAQSDVALARELGLSGTLVWEPYLPYREGLARLAAAHLQILLAYGEETLYVPAKTFDYLLTGAPVLALTQADELRGIIETTGTGVVVGPSDVQGVADALVRTLAAARTGTPLVTPDAAAVQCHAAPAITGQLCALLDAIAR